MTATAAKPAKLPREEDPRNPVLRLTALLDEGSLELITPDDDSGMLAHMLTMSGDGYARAREILTRLAARDPGWGRTGFVVDYQGALLASMTVYFPK